MRDKDKTCFWMSVWWKTKKESTRLSDTGLIGVLEHRKFLCLLLWINKVRTKEKTYTWVLVELEHLKIKTRLIDEKFVSVRGECEI
jgi:hypothetical protein